ncbi:hypothetical protein CMALT430_490013 [Carnobacterium maltaromaticum]|nr:hypothetical protein CMALT430_490013 [Carnobacterium maltaromaticum]
MAFCWIVYTCIFCYLGSAFVKIRLIDFTLFTLILLAIAGLFLDVVFHVSFGAFICVSACIILMSWVAVNKVLREC